MIQCPNYSCQAINAEAHQFCQTCQAPVPRRVLWAVGHRAEEFKPGALISDRYLCKSPQIFLDLKPGLPPGTLSDIPFSVLPYLRLTPHRLHLPQVYGWADGTLESGDMTRLMFLENSALSSPTSTDQTGFTLLPALHDVWSAGSAFQQLHWLWQIANLWHPLSTEHIASTLLVSAWIRVEASLIRLIQLHPPQSNGDMPQPSISKLGQCWQDFLSSAKPEIQPFMKQICQKLVEGYFHDGQALVTALDLGLQAVGRSHTIELGIATQTDKGPSRVNNQDACFPSSGTVNHSTLTPSSAQKQPTTEQPKTSLIVVCDGIGGHQGGEIASATAIDEITHTLQTLELPTEAEGLHPWIVHDHLNVAIAQANSAINQRNDDEKRRERARMGTTVVMGLIHNHECYLSHVGDSRVYWITRAGCHQITLDDDVASREARLGYGTYRSVLYHPNAGALVQALGMGPSKNLYPSGQRIILGEDGILLFCSDGLSDQDLIETSWPSALFPLLDPSTIQHSTQLLGRVVNDLVELANTRNGHDNVTVGIVQWHSRQTEVIQIPDLDTLIHMHNSQVERGLSSVNTPKQNDNDPDNDPPTRPPVTTTLSFAQPLDTASLERSSQGESVSETRTAFPDAAFTPSPMPASPAISGATDDNSTSSQGAPSPSKDAFGSAFPDDHTDWISSSPPPRSRRSPLLAGITIMLGFFSILVLAGAMAYLGIPDVSDRINAALGINPDADDSRSPSPPPDLKDPDAPHPLPNASPTNPTPGGIRDIDETLTIGHILNLRTSAPVPRTLEPPEAENQTHSVGETTVLLLFENPPVRDVVPSTSALEPPSINNQQTLPNPAINPVGVVPWGSILQVKNTREETSDQADPNALPQNGGGNSGQWVQVQLCFIPSDAAPMMETGNTKVLSVGSTGWISERQLKELSYLDRVQASPFNEHCADGS